jgi:hypothetical protein
LAIGVSVRMVMCGRGKPIVQTIAGLQIWKVIVWATIAPNTRICVSIARRITEKVGFETLMQPIINAVWMMMEMACVIVINRTRSIVRISAAIL